MARLVDIAAAANVSVGLVSRVLNQDPSTRATAETRERIERLAADLGYRPHYAARALKSARTDTISLVVPDLTNAMFTELMRGVEEESHRVGYTVLLGRSESLTDQSHISHLLEEGRVDGFLLQARDDEGTESLTRLVGRAPVVLINSRVQSRPGSVMIDDHGAAQLATNYLVEHGHRRIGLINGVPTSLTARLREAGYRAALRENGIALRSNRITRLGYTVTSAAPAVDAVMSQRSPPTALLVSNVNAAFGVLAQARARGLRVPEDLSVIAIHDAWTADHTWPPLTTVRMPLRHLGAQAVLALRQRLSGGEGVDVVVTSPAPQILERASVRGRS
jgi:LacI family transcriptional regulator